jgi:hypothetical protein
VKKIAKIEEIESFKLYDLMVEEEHCFSLENGVIAHNSMYPKTIMSGGTGPMLSADTVFFIGKSQNKKGTEIEGYNFTITTEKSRFVKEKSKFEISVSWDNGIEYFSGLLDIALEGGYVTKPSNGFYMRTHIPGDKKVRESVTLNEEFWKPIFEETDFKDYCKKRYSIEGTDKIIASTIEDLEDLEDE